MYKFGAKMFAQVCNISVTELCLYKNSVLIMMMMMMKPDEKCNF